MVGEVDLHGLPPTCSCGPQGLSVGLGRSAGKASDFVVAPGIRERLEHRFAVEFGTEKLLMIRERRVAEPALAGAGRPASGGDGADRGSGCFAHHGFSRMY